MVFLLYQLFLAKCLVFQAVLEVLIHLLGLITREVYLTYTILSSLGPVICTSRSFAPGFTAKQNT